MTKQRNSCIFSQLTSIPTGLQGDQVFMVPPTGSRKLNSYCDTAGFPYNLKGLTLISYVLPLKGCLKISDSILKPNCFIKSTLL